MWRGPYFWGDDSEMFEKDPIWRLADERLDVGGLRVFDFHPFHIAMNTTSYEHYERCKRLQPLQTWDEAFIEEHTQQGCGPRNLFVELAERLAGSGNQIRELVDIP